jgi:hypothetical protein
LCKDDDPYYAAASFQDFKWQQRQKEIFPLPKGESELAGLSLSQERFKMSCDGVVRTITNNKFVDPFRRWMDRCGKYVRFGGP